MTRHSRCINGSVGCAHCIGFAPFRCRRPRSRKRIGGRLKIDSSPRLSGCLDHLRNLGGAIGLAMIDTVIYTRSAVHGVAIMDSWQAGDIGTAKFVGTARRFCSASSRSARWRYSRNDAAIGGKGRAGSGHQRSLDHDRSADRRGLTLRTVCKSLTKDEQRPLKQKDERQIDSHGLTPVVDVRLRHHAEHMVA
jgi:hypothetical protein